MQEMSIPDQRKILRKYCRDKGYEIIEEFIDEGISGTTFEKRPGVMRLFQKVQSKHQEFSLVIILNESRFARVEDLDIAFYYQGLLKINGVSVEYAQSESNVPGTVGFLLRVMKLSQAAEFSKQLSKDVIRGHSTAAGKGYSTGGFPPLGYARMVCDENGHELDLLKPGHRKGIKNHWVKWVPGDSQAVALVKRIFNMYAEGSKGYKELCRVLNAEKISSPKGGSWGADTVRSILVNRAYIGERIYGGKWARKVQEKVIRSNAHEAIIPKDLFERVHAQMKSRDFGRCSGMRTEYLLSGKIVCKRCGHKFQGRRVKNSVGKVYQYYIDSGYKNYRVCASLNIPQHTEGNVIGLDDFVIGEVQKMLDNDRYVERFKAYLKEALIGIERETETAYPALKKREKELKAEIESTIDELLKVKSEALRERLKKGEAELDCLKREIEKYENIKSQPSKVLLLVNEYARVMKNVGEVLKRRTPGEQKTAVGYFLDRIEVLREEGVARCYFYDTPRPKEVDYLLPGSSSGVLCTSRWCRRGDSNPHGVSTTRP